MDRNQPTEELRDEKLIELAREKSAGLLAAVRAGQPQATKLLLDCLGDYLADDNTLAQLVRESLAGTNSLQGVITDLIWTEAEAMAQRELAAIKREHREVSITDRIHRYLDTVAA